MARLEEMNEDELYSEALCLHEENKPYLAKMYAREELTPDEQRRHEEIIQQAQRILELQREHGIRARATRHQQETNRGNGEPLWFKKAW